MKKKYFKNKEYYCWQQFPKRRKRKIFFNKKNFRKFSNELFRVHIHVLSFERL